MGKNSLAAVKATDKSKNELPTDTKLEVHKVGRKAKPKAEKASKPITLKFTESELKIIEEKSGLIPNATFLKQLLLTQTDLFK